MTQKIVCLAIILLFVFSILPITLVEAQTVTPIKVTQKIATEPTPLISETTNILNEKVNPSINNSKARVKPSPTPETYALTIEIDYIVGHAPTQHVLDYMTAYYQAQNIELTIIVDQAIPNEPQFEDGISEAEFWTIETLYNQGNDFTVNSNRGKYTLPEKWVLYGTTVEGSENIAGYTFCVGSVRDLKAGNYIYIADKTVDDWAVLPSINVAPEGAEAVVLMHEFGHSIGIAIIQAGSEIYCSDGYCVMSYLRPENAGNTDKWYYCSSHWNTKNLDYYA